MYFMFYNFAPHETKLFLKVKLNDKSDGMNKRASFHIAAESVFFRKYFHLSYCARLKLKNSMAKVSHICLHLTLNSRFCYVIWAYNVLIRKEKDTFIYNTHV